MKVPTISDEEQKLKTKKELLAKLEDMKKDPFISDLELVIIEVLEYLINDNRNH